MAKPLVPGSLVLDSGAISALAAGESRARAILVERRRRGAAVLTPAVVVAETTTGRGPSDAAANRVLSGVRVVPVLEELARSAGALRHRARRPALDAIVVATAQAVQGIVLTADVDDMSALAAVAEGVRVRSW